MLEDELGLARHRRAQTRQHEIARLEPAEEARRPGPPLRQGNDRPGPARRRDRPPPLPGASRFSQSIEQVDPGGEDGLDGVRDRDVGQVGVGAPAVLAPHDPALRRSGGGGSPRRRTDCRRPARRSAHGASRGGPRSTARRSNRRLVSSAGSGSRTMPEKLRRPPPQARASVGQIGSGRAEEQDAALDAFGQLVEEVEQRLIGPVDVLHDDDQRRRRPPVRRRRSATRRGSRPAAVRGRGDRSRIRAERSRRCSRAARRSEPGRRSAPR